MRKGDRGLISPKTDEESRRDFLKKAGKMALYTPPAIMMLMQPSRHALACSVRPQKYKYQFSKVRSRKVKRFKRDFNKRLKFRKFRDD